MIWDEIVAAPASAQSIHSSIQNDPSSPEPSNASTPTAPASTSPRSPPPARRPLVMTTSPNVPSLPSTSRSSHSRLKRLSLVPAPHTPRPSQLPLASESPRPADGLSPDAGSSPDPASSSDTTTQSSPPVSRILQHTSNANIPLAGEGPSTPRRPTRAVRSSISYSSPIAPVSRIVDQDHPTPKARREPDIGGHGTTHRTPIWEGAESSGSGRGERPKRGETLVEQHADLLTLIAQKERRVNELKQELSAQESSLAQLKERWTTLVTRQTHTHSHPPPTIHRIRPSAPAPSGPSRPHHPLSQDPRRSPNPEPSSSPSPPTPAEPAPPSHGSTALDQGLASLLSSIPGTIPLHTDKILSGEAIEGGKRFWDQLVKTVSAAAAGTVPDGLAPWSSGLASQESPKVGSGGEASGKTTSTGPKHPRRPANAARLSCSSVSDLDEREDTHDKESRQVRLTSSSGDKTRLINDWMTDEAEEIEGKALTPQRPDRLHHQLARHNFSSSTPDATPSAGSNVKNVESHSAGGQKGHAEESGSEDGWGW